MRRLSPLCLFFLLLPSPAAAQQKCLRAGCHVKISQLAKKHTALGSGCSACHLPAPTRQKKHRFRLVAQGRALCRLCHTWPTRKHRHAAFVFGQCSTCHSPHGSSHPSNLTDWPVSRLCSICHPTGEALRSRHKPFDEGHCQRCHEPHASDSRALLRARPYKVCTRCHETDKLLKGAYRHPPAAQGECLGCHDPHQSRYPRLVRVEGKKLCRRCHKTEPNLKRRYVHKAMASPCPTCHTPHASKYRKLLNVKTPELCYGCHKPLDNKPVVHSAVKLGRCGGCHDPHAANNLKLLRAGQTSKLCFRCHCDDVTRRATVHWPVKGGICDRCHEPHGSDEQKLLKVKPEQLCDKCHSSQRARTGKDVRVHGALRRAGCLACHDSHASSNPAVLKRPINQLCAACHPKQRSGRHVFSGAMGKPHPVSKVPDPIFAGRRMSCITCHAMSSSTLPNLLRGGGKDKRDFCGLCHEGGFGKPTAKPQRIKPSHNHPRIPHRGAKKRLPDTSTRGKTKQRPSKKKRGVKKSPAQLPEQPPGRRTPASQPTPGSRPAAPPSTPQGGQAT